ncbi:putative fimbrial protein StaE [Serratia fonticola]|nr:putative fimbrial protein StaE [Serratia fonticola]
MKKHWQKTVSALALAVLATAGLTSQDVRAAGESVELKFNYTVLQGTCEVSVGSDGLDGVLDFGHISTSGLTTKNWDPLVATGARKVFKVKLSKCSGTPDLNTQPGITLSGTTDTGTQNANNKAFLFVDSTSTAKGIGFAIFKDSSSSGPGNVVAEITSSVTGQKYIPVGTGGAGSVVNKDTTIDLSAMVTCGSTCAIGDRPKMRAGALSASVTFNFVYY